MNDPCPCGSGRAFADCCAVYHRGGDAPTAEALMRARYSAYARGDAAFLARSSHPLLRARLKAKDLRQSFAIVWSGLEVVATSGGGATDNEGSVHFRAHYRLGTQAKVLEERSRFVRVDGLWVYRDGHS